MPEAYLKIQEVMTRVKLGRSTIYRNISAGTFPGAYELSEGRVGWRESEINSWCESRPAVRARVRVMRRLVTRQGA